MNYKVIASGSKGNAVVINDTILIDCGVSFKSLKDCYRKLSLVLLTHSHNDHTNLKTIAKLALERPILRFACCEWLVPKLIESKVKAERIDVLKCGTQYKYPICSIIPVFLTHDVPNCGYKLQLASGEKILYATDTANLDDISAINFDLYLLEANYEDEEINQRIAEKLAKGEYSYEQRVLITHLSKQQCDDFLLENASDKSELVYLHKHKEDKP